MVDLQEGWRQNDADLAEENKDEGAIMKDFRSILNRFSQCRIAVVGDLILDEYIFGQVDRISPEAPVPIVRVTEEKYALGGAANVAANLATLRGNVFLFGVTGDDPARQIMLERARLRTIDSSGILIDQRKPTVRKTRIIGLNQQLLRIDHENISYIESHLENSFLQQLDKISSLDAVIISDYAKGTVTRELLTGLRQFCLRRKIRLIIDPRPKHKPWYQQADLITPNRKEAEEMSGISIETDEDFLTAGQIIARELETSVILTAGEKGMFVIEKLAGTEFRTAQIPTVAREVYDVSGAGDTVVATLALALSSGADLTAAATLANQAAGIKVGKVGTSPVEWEELAQEIDNGEPEN